MKKYVLRFRAQDRAIFNALKDGRKSVETRAATERFQKIVPGDRLVFSCQGQSFDRPVRVVRRYLSVRAMLEEIDFREIAPWLKSAEELENLYKSFPGYQEKIAKFGILAFS